MTTTSSPVIRNRDYLASLKYGGVGYLHEPLGADLVVVYMADTPGSMSPIKLTDVPGKDLATIRRIALANMRKWLPKLVSDHQMGDGVLYYVDENTLLSPSLILLPEFWKSIAARFPADVLIALPRKDQLFIFDDGDAKARAGMRRLIAVTIEEGFKRPLAAIICPSQRENYVGGRIVSSEAKVDRMTISHWLLKSEPNSYAFADLQRDGSTIWDGVRNNAAALHLKAMNVGDEAFFYHSQEGKEIVGIARIVRPGFSRHIRCDRAFRRRRDRAGAGSRAPRHPGRNEG